MTNELLAGLEEIAQAPLLLVVSDFDGTLAPIVAHPSQVEADRNCVVALRALSQLPQTHVALISGRALADLSEQMRDVEAHLVGSHGSEFEAGAVSPLPPETVEMLGRVKEAVSEIAQRTKGTWLEVKPSSLAFHYRQAEDAAAMAAVDAILRGPGSWPGMYVRHGKKVIELSIVKTDKGAALKRLRQRLGATAVLFLGDDVTDEDAFAVLSGPDVGVKVGPGQSKAKYAVAGISDVARVLALVAEKRAEWLAGSKATPIEQHSLLSDQRTVALLDPRGRIVWMCLPRIDSPAFFAELLGGAPGGYFEVLPRAAESSLGQAYVGDSFVLETRWPTFTVTDYLDCSGGRPFQRAGRTDLIRVIQGRGDVRVTFAPRLDFGRMDSGLRIGPSGVQVEGSVDGMVLYTSGLDWRLTTEGKHQTAVAEFTLREGEPLVLELRYGTESFEPDAQPEPDRRERSARFWSGWAAALQLPPVAKDLVRRSALVLKALSYGPSGAIAAASTTSLPEHAGGVRNWDYRFCWPRDAAMSAAALVRLGVTGPAIKFLDWVLGVLEKTESSSWLAPVYTVTGAHLGPEATLAELAGYRGSRPVRVGNLAAQQIQLDVLGPIAELVALLAKAGAALSADHWNLITTMVNAVQHRWSEPDHGIWEARRPRKHHVHSRVMCWQTVDRGLRVARYMGKKRDEWSGLRDQIAADILQNGWKPEVNSFGSTYDDTEPDAATLAVGLSGLLPPNDPRFLGTLEYIDKRLRRGPTVLRYLYDDGLPGVEGGFHLCTTWMIEARALVGQRDAAMRLFEDYVRLAGPTGLMSEEYDADSALALGNFPQAYSHLGLINAALALAS